jgi:hypothetical protein
MGVVSVPPIMRAYGSGAAVKLRVVGGLSVKECMSTRHPLPFGCLRGGVLGSSHRLPFERLCVDIMGDAGYSLIALKLSPTPQLPEVSI